MKISIALATYNGEVYLINQLESFLSQSRLPDEIVVSDDGSTDGTKRILDAFRSQTNISVKIFRNSSGRGVAKNFNNAIRRASGDLILLSDQDDVWLPGKLKVYEDFFLQNPKVHLVLSDAAIIQEGIQGTTRTKLDYFRDRGYALDNFCTGCCMGFRRSFLDLSMPIPFDNYAHDVWLNDVAVALGSRAIIDEVTMYYRRHGSNFSNHLSSRIANQGFLSDVLSLIKTQRKGCKRQSISRNSVILLNHFEKLLHENPKIIDDIDCVIGKLRLKVAEDTDRDHRLSKPFLARTWLSLRAYRMGRYRRYNGLLSLMKDIFYK